MKNHYFLEDLTNFKTCQALETWQVYIVA